MPLQCYAVDFVCRSKPSTLLNQVLNSIIWIEQLLITSSPSKKQNKTNNNQKTQKPTTKTHKKPHQPNIVYTVKSYMSAQNSLQTSTSDHITLFHLCSLGRMGLAMCIERWGRQADSQLQEPFVGKMETKDSTWLSWGKLHLSLVLFSWNKVVWALGNMMPFPRVVEHQTFRALCLPDSLHKSQLGIGFQGCQSSFDEVQPQSLTTQELWSLQENIL